MIRWCTSRSSNPACWALAAVLVMSGATVSWAATQAEREPITMKVVAVNPSEEKTRTVPVRIDLPLEVKPADILEHGELLVEFDTDRSLYYVHKPDVELAPKQTKVFEVIVNDVWMIPEVELEGLIGHTNLLLKRLEDSDYYPFAQQLGSTILERLNHITATQSDETVGRRQHIGAFRHNTQALKGVKEDLARMEKLLSFTGGPPVPEMMEESPLKSDAPSTTTTWLVIFLVMIFMGLLAGQFFFTWQRRVKMMPEFAGGKAGGDASEHAAAGNRGDIPGARTPTAR